MKTLKDLIQLINEVQMREALNDYLIRADVKFSITPYFENGEYEKTLLSFDYSNKTANTDNKKFSFIADPKELTEDKIQHYYWAIKIQCARG